MSGSPATEVPCRGCGAPVPEIEGPTHRYLESSAGCWQLYGNVLAKEFGDVLYGVAHPFSVDAYAVQHPGSPSPQTIQSLAVHLISLCLVFENGVPPHEAARARQRAKARFRDEFAWLEPPSDLGAVTVVHVERASGPEEHRERAEEWARSAWRAWRIHHPVIRAFASRL